MKVKRKLSPYELTHLARFAKQNINITKYGQMPVEYITGKCEFYGHVFDVNRDVLIPRVESEQIVDLAMHAVGLPAGKAGTGYQPVREIIIAEIGTGSGAIGLSLACELNKKNQNFEIYLSDISAPALTVGTENFLSLQKAGQIKTGQVNFLNSDLLANYPQNIKFDLIIANLPYIPSERVNYLPESVKDFEPKIALDGGPDGLKIIKKLIKQSLNFLKSKPKIILEIDHTHDLTDFKFAKKNFDIKLIKDIYGQNRFIILCTNG